MTRDRFGLISSGETLGPAPDRNLKTSANSLLIDAGGDTPAVVLARAFHAVVMTSSAFMIAAGFVVSALAQSPSIAADDCTLTLTAFCPGDPAVVRVSGIADVTDGDTLDVGPAQIRLHGIDTPEAGQTCKTAAGDPWPCGDRATARLAALVDGKRATCFARERDAYGRLIALCVVGGKEVNPVMVREGLAWAFVRYSRDYAALETKARESGIGVWQGEAEPPWQYRENKWARAAAASPRPGCPIKGNINRHGERIYHTPWSPVYDRTIISESDGERWFCDEAEALVAGWRAARWR